MSFLYKIGHNISRSFATSVKPAIKQVSQSVPVFRAGTLKDIEQVTRMAIQEGWHVGPYDFKLFLEFDPKSYHIGEVNGKHVCQVSKIEFPQHHFHSGSSIVAEGFRNRGYGKICIPKSLSPFDSKYTIGGDMTVGSLPLFEPLGYKKYWDTYVATFDLEKIAEATLEGNSSTPVPIPNVDLEKLLQYDQAVFGTPRDKLMKRWFNTPGSFGWAAIDNHSDEITGYIVLKQVIREGGLEIGLAMAPLFANNKNTAKLLIKKAGEECLSNWAIPKTKLELFHPLGDVCGEGGAELMKELGAELIHIAHRVYSKGIPEGRQTRNIYGITSPSCD